MGRWAISGQKDRAWVQDGDPAFRGIDMIHDRSTLAPGYLAKAENKRLREGTAATRPGTGLPNDFNPVFANKILGSGIYSNPNGEEVMLVAELNVTYVWALQFNKDPVKINLVAGQNTGTNPLGLVQFVQAFDKVLMLRFPIAGQPPLVWDGINANTFNAITLIPPGATLIPTTLFGVPHKNRLVLYDPYTPAASLRDHVYLTDVNNYSSYDTVYGDVRINAGESDMIVSVLPFFKDSLIVFKKGSIHMLENFTEPLATATGSGDQRMLTNQLGGVSVRLPIMVGTDIMFASEPGGFYRISEVIQEQIGTQPVPISRRIQPVIDQIDWGRMGWWGCSALLGDYAYFGITRKGFGTNGLIPACDAVLVYNTVTNEWESAPDWRDDPSFLINALHVTLYNGAQRLFALDYTNSRIYLMDEGIEDEVNGDIIPIYDIMESRGYVCNDPAGFKRFERVSIGLRTYDPNAVVTAISDGVNEEKQLAVVTKDRTKFYVHGHKDFDVNAGDDATEQKREDYSPVGDFDNFAVEDFENLPEGPIDFLPPTGAAVQGPKQQSLERFQIRQNGRWVSIRIENTGGQCDCLGSKHNQMRWSASRILCSNTSIRVSRPWYAIRMMNLGTRRFTVRGMAAMRTPSVYWSWGSYRCSVSASKTTDGAQIYERHNYAS